MTDKEYNTQKKRVGKFLTKWQGPMGLRWWNIEVIFDRSYSHSGAAAETDMNQWRYRMATITFYLPKICEEERDDEVEKLVIHELCHALMSPISINMKDLDNDYQHDLMEFNTQMVTDAFWWVYQEGKNAKV